LQYITYYIEDGQEAIEPNRRYWESAVSIHNLVWDPRNDSHIISNVRPRGVGRTNNRIPLAWDLDMDGYIDPIFLTRDLIGMENSNRLWLITEEEGTIRGFPPFFPTLVSPYAGGSVLHSHNIHNAHARTTMIHDDLIAMMWVDSSKTWLFRHNDHTHLIQYLGVTEVFIVISNDSGTNWSDPLVLNGLTNPELGTVPAFVWPADKIYRVSDDIVRLYFMYTNDLAYGPPPSTTYDPGSEVRYAALDIDISALSVSENDRVVPRPIAMLNQNFPNPFNPTTTISFTNPTAGVVNLSVYNIRGQRVKTLTNEFMPVGQKEIVWNGVDSNNRSVASGVYFYRLEANGRTEVRRMVLMK
jgi:hypothetical protein